MQVQPHYFPLCALAFSLVSLSSINTARAATAVTHVQVHHQAATHTGAGHTTTTHTTTVHTHIRTTPRFDHAFNRPGIRAFHHLNPHTQITLPHIQHPNIVSLRNQMLMEQHMLVGHDSSSTKVSGHYGHHHNNDNQAGSLPGAAGNDNGGADTSSSDSGQRAVNSTAITTEQAQEFGKIVKNRFKEWDLDQDGKLSASNIGGSLKNRSNLTTRETAALAAMGWAIANPQVQSAKNNRYYTLKSLTKLAKKAELEHESALLHLFKLNAEHLEKSSIARQDAINTSTEPATVQDKPQPKVDDQDELATALAAFPLPPEAATAATAEVTEIFDNARANSKITKIQNTSLDKGSILVAHEHQVNVRCGKSTVDVSPGAVAYILHQGDEVAVYNLSDFKHGDVRINVADKSFRVPVGNEMLITTKQHDEFKDCNPLKDITCTKSSRTARLQGVDVYTAEFSPTSALDNIAQFQMLVDSDRPEDRQLAERIIKTAAIIMTLNASN